MATVGPVEKQGRIRGLDVLRGVALLGILVVNAQQLFQPWLYGNDPVAVVPGESGVWWTWAVVHMLVDTKFLALFTLLFGVGFALQAGRGEARDPSGFRRIYLRRLSLLAIFGLIHGLFFYAADVLIIYAVTGFALFRFRSWSAGRMLAVGSALLLATVIWHDIISTLSSVRVTATLGSFLVFALVARLLARRGPRLFLPVSLALLALFAVEQQRAVPFKGGGAGRFEEKQAIAAALADEPSDFVLVDGTRHETPLSRDALAARSRSSLALSALHVG